jgi:phosphatidylglycerol---prolipoprotein diacylglyceryl transferase
VWGPYLFGSVSTYSTFVLASAVVGMLVVMVCARGAGIPTWRILLLECGLAVAALTGAKLWGVIEDRAFSRLAWTTLIGEFRYPGALAGLLLAVPLLARVCVPGTSIAALADLVAPSIGFAEVVGRMGCFLHGCCFGVVTTVPWAVRFPPDSPAARFHAVQQMLPGGSPSSLPVHPLQLYFAALSGGIGAFLLWFGPRKSYDGQLILLFVALHEWGKVLLEFLRAPVAGAAGAYLQLGSLVLALLATSALVGRRIALARRPAIV